jgi:hypothetical protein
VASNSSSLQNGCSWGSGDEIPRRRRETRNRKKLSMRPRIVTRQGLMVAIRRRILVRGPRTIQFSRSKQRSYREFPHGTRRAPLAHSPLYRNFSER